MFWSMAPLVLVCIVLAGVLGMCSFTPSGPTTGAPPSYDAHAALQADARQFSFPIREPSLPEGGARTPVAATVLTEYRSRGSGI